MNNLEDRFTPSSGFCVHPEYWTSPDSEATENEISEFIYGLVRGIQPNFVLETGTYHGHTTYAIARALAVNGHGAVVSIEKDTLEHNIASTNLEELGKNELLGPYALLNMNSMDYEPTEDIEFAFFDSWQEGRAEEFLRFHKMGRLGKDTIVAFHDSAPHHQVHWYIEELERDGFIKTITLHSPRGLTLGQVLENW